MYLGFIDLEKAYDGVPKDVIKYRLHISMFFLADFVNLTNVGFYDSVCLMIEAEFCSVSEKAKSVNVTKNGENLGYQKIYLLACTNNVPCCRHRTDQHSFCKFGNVMVKMSPFSCFLCHWHPHAGKEVYKC